MECVEPSREEAGGGGESSGGTVERGISEKLEMSLRSLPLIARISM